MLGKIQVSLAISIAVLVDFAFLGAACLGQVQEVQIQRLPNIELRGAIEIRRMPVQRGLALRLQEEQGEFSFVLQREATNPEDSAEKLLEQFGHDAQNRTLSLLRVLEEKAELTPSQREKLLAAAKGDIGRVARQLRLMQFTYGGPIVQNEIQLSIDSLAELNQLLQQQLYSSQSLYAKVFDSVLTDAQKDQLAQEYITWFTTRVRELDAQGRDKLQKLMWQYRDKAPVSVARQTYCSGVIQSIPPPVQATAVDGRQLEYVRRLAEAWAPK